MIRPALLLPFALILAGCASSQGSSIRLALDGPPLAVVMQSEGQTEHSVWNGLMDRGCMAGAGTIALRGTDGVTCQGDMDHPANEKGRLYADLACDNGKTMVVVFRNLGPDQGMGVARLDPDNEDGEQATLFFHPSREEAERRLGEIRAEVASALEAKRKKTEELKSRTTD